MLVIKVVLDFLLSITFEQKGASRGNCFKCFKHMIKMFVFSPNTSSEERKNHLVACFTAENHLMVFVGLWGKNLTCREAGTKEVGTATFPSRNLWLARSHNFKSICPIDSLNTLGCISR